MEKLVFLFCFGRILSVSWNVFDLMVLGRSKEEREAEKVSYLGKSGGYKISGDAPSHFTISTAKTAKLQNFVIDKLIFGQNNKSLVQ